MRLTVIHLSLVVLVGVAAVNIGLHIAGTATNGEATKPLVVSAASTPCRDGNDNDPVKPCIKDDDVERGQGVGMGKITELSFFSQNPGEEGKRVDLLNSRDFVLKDVTKTLFTLRISVSDGQRIKAHLDSLLDEGHPDAQVGFLEIIPQLNVEIPRDTLFHSFIRIGKKRIDLWGDSTQIIEDSKKFYKTMDSDLQNVIVFYKIIYILRTSETVDDVMNRLNAVENDPDIAEFIHEMTPQPIVEKIVAAVKAASEQGGGIEPLRQTVAELYISDQIARETPGRELTSEEKEEIRQKAAVVLGDASTTDGLAELFDATSALITLRREFLAGLEPATRIGKVFHIPIKKNDYFLDGESLVIEYKSNKINDDLRTAIIRQIKEQVTEGLTKEKLYDKGGRVIALEVVGRSEITCSQKGGGRILFNLQRRAVIPFSR